MRTKRWHFIHAKLPDIATYWYWSRPKWPPPAKRYLNIVRYVAAMYRKRGSERYQSATKEVFRNDKAQGQQAAVVGNWRERHYCHFQALISTASHPSILLASRVQSNSDRWLWGLKLLGGLGRKKQKRHEGRTWTKGDEWGTNGEHERQLRG